MRTTNYYIWVWNILNHFYESFWNFFKDARLDDKILTVRSFIQIIYLSLNIKNIEMESIFYKISKGLFREKITEEFLRPA